VNVRAPVDGLAPEFAHLALGLDDFFALEVALEDVAGGEPARDRSDRASGGSDRIDGVATI
jgi:hypothetical protein